MLTSPRRSKLSKRFQRKRKSLSLKLQKTLNISIKKSSKARSTTLAKTLEETKMKGSSSKESKSISSQSNQRQQKNSRKKMKTDLRLRGSQMKIQQYRSPQLKKSIISKQCQLKRWHRIKKSRSHRGSTWLKTIRMKRSKNPQISSQPIPLDGA